MKKLLICCLLFLGGVYALAQSNTETKSIQILASSQLSIKGDTNINEFECDFNTNYLGDPIAITYLKKGNEINFNNAVLSLNNKGFDCGSKGINKDLHALLKTNQYPTISIELTDIIFEASEEVNAYVIITIAGKKKKYSFPVTTKTSSKPRFIGRLKLDIRDFNLEPPRKIFGLIVINEKIEINFDLLVKI